jgi:enamine deaminase RidA (YjgF/YER057c/UK114 family)
VSRIRSKRKLVVSGSCSQIRPRFHLILKRRPWVRIRENKAYISGHGPQNPDGSITGLCVRVGTELSVEQGYESAKLAGLSILGSLKRQIGTLDLVIAWLDVRGYVNTVPTFTETTNVINGFSDLILRLYGPDIGAHARSAIGVQALPLGLPLSASYACAKVIGNPLVYHLSSDEPWRATVAISDATTLLKLGHNVTLLLSVEGVQIGDKL